MAYSNDLRQSVMQYVESGGSKSKAVAIFGISLKSIWNWIKKKKEGDLAPKKRAASPRKLNQEQLFKFIESHPDAYLREIAEFFDVTIQAIFYACKRYKISLKKRRHSTKSETKQKGPLFKEK